MSTKAALDNAIARKSKALTAGYLAGVSFWSYEVRDLERQLWKEEKAELIEACKMALAALESPEAQKVLAWTEQREALRNVLMKLEQKEMTC